ncbi:MAG: polyprenyl synthetase family protein [Betaproteobacteria bacterium]|jgi:geranylgeranyl diphosphate synthase type II
MAAFARIEDALESALVQAQGPGCPPQLAAAVRHAVFPGGARIRPQLCLAVARACGDDRPELSEAAAAAIELLHCASLVHDDLPCFDDAPVRRGQPSVHSAFGERLAVLAGDGLIVVAFQVLARAGAQAPDRLVRLLTTIAGSVGMPGGIVAGQAWECEARVSISQYHREKTGSLFAAATVSGAQAAGGDAEAWRGLGEWLGEAYQAADDIRDVVADAQQLGKPIGRDAALGRPSVARERGLPAAMRHFDTLVRNAVEAVPECRGAPMLRALVRSESERLVPTHLAAPLRAAA